MKSNEKRSPGRPRDFDRAQALESALTLFWQHGYEGTSVSMLTEKIGITAPSLYAAFGSKEGLYTEAIKLYLASHANFVTQSIQEEKAAKTAVEKILERSALAFTQKKMPHGCLIASGNLACGSDASGVAKLTSQLRTHAKHRIQKRLAEAIGSGELPATADPVQLADYYAAVIQGMSVQAIDGATVNQLRGIAAIAMKAWPGKVRSKT
jgi:AcrR family transcriptional regulator